MKRILMAIGGVAMCAPLLAWSQSDVVASAGQVSVTQSDMTTLLKSLSPDNRIKLAADPAQLDQLVRVQLANKAILAEAHAKGWDKQPQVEAMVAQAQREVVARSYLVSISAPPPDYPSAQEIQAAYDQNQAAFTVPRSLHFAQIFISVPPGADAATQDAARKRATDLAKQAHGAKADFAALARANSEDKASAANGGDMGFVPENALLPEIRKAADGMKPGEVSAPIQSTAGLHIVRLIETRPGGVRPLADVTEQIRTVLRTQRAQQSAQAYMAKTVQPSSVAINEDALKKALSSAQ